MHNKCSKALTVYNRGLDSGGMGGCIPPQFKVGGGGDGVYNHPPGFSDEKKISGNRD